jgi:hypothetical protein
MDLETKFYHSISNLSIYVAEGILGLAAVAVAKTVIWPPLAFYLREKWDWPQSKGKSPYSCFILKKFKIFFKKSFFKKLKKTRMIWKWPTLLTKLVGPKDTGVGKKKHEVGCKKSGISRPSTELPDDKALEGMHVLISMISYHLAQSPHYILPQKI